MPQNSIRNAPRGEPSGSGAALRGMWASQLRWWHLGAATMLLLIVIVILLQPAGPHGRWPSLLTTAALAVLYVTIGTRALTLRSAPATAFPYLILAWAAVLLTQWLDPQFQSWLFYFVLFPHVWAMLPRRFAVVTTVVLLVATAGVNWHLHRGHADLVSLLVTTAISLMLSVALGLLISSAFTEAAARADIIDELRSTQSRLVAAERDRGVLAERERLSQEIHDTLAQGFVSILTLARAAEAALARDDVETARQRLALVQSTAAENLTEARLIVAETAPEHFQSRTLVEALERLVATVDTGAGLEARFELVGTPVSSGAATDVVLLRAAQESLSNIRRHARATTVRVTLAYLEDEPVTLNIMDDGVGFDPALPNAGFGLDGVRARAEQVGGVAVVDSSPGQGTSVRVEVPR